MTVLPVISPAILWPGFLILVTAFLLIDLGLFNKKQHAVSVKEALIWTCIWISLSLLFNVFIWLEFGKTKALEFLTSYIIEKSLSLDNIFVIFLIFASFKIDKKYQHKVLFWGIIGAIIMRGALIIAGAALVIKFKWILYIFGAFLVYGGFKMFFKKDEEFDPHDSIIVRGIKKIVHVARNHQDGKLFVKDRLKRGVTILFVALLVIEFTDVVFAFDSIPAIFGITTDPFIVFTSNIFAILGLRSLYFVVAKIHDDFIYLNVGLACVLIFVGLKMLLSKWLHISIIASLVIVASLLGASIIASLIHKKYINKKEKKTAKHKKSKKKKLRI